MQDLPNKLLKAVEQVYAAHFPSPGLRELVSQYIELNAKVQSASIWISDSKLEVIHLMDQIRGIIPKKIEKPKMRKKMFNRIEPFGIIKGRQRSFSATAVE
jgi:hypothetical protein